MPSVRIFPMRVRSARYTRGGRSVGRGRASRAGGVGGIGAPARLVGQAAGAAPVAAGFALAGFLRPAARPPPAAP